ncbi:MAG: hypothetical protein WD229_11195 [Pirellulales bacterium]
MRPRYLTSFIASLLVLTFAGCDAAPPAGTNTPAPMNRQERVFAKVSPSQKEAAKALEALGGEVGINEDDADPLILEVDFSQSKVTDADLAQLQELPSIRILNFHNTAITDEGLKHLVGLPDLVLLDLSKTKVTDKGLAQLAGFTNLKRLSLLDLPVTDASIAHLKVLKTLDSVGIRGTKITPAGVEELKRALPDVQADQ